MDDNKITTWFKHLKDVIKLHERRIRILIQPKEIMKILFQQVAFLKTQSQITITHHRMLYGNIQWKMMTKENVVKVLILIIRRK